MCHGSDSYVSRSWVEPLRKAIPVRQKTDS
nr:MAG TPA: hypothetical protein [Herelleviridae sp.]